METGSGRNSVVYIFCLVNMLSVPILVHSVERSKTRGEILDNEDYPDKKELTSTSSTLINQPQTVLTNKKSSSVTNENVQETTPIVGPSLGDQVPQLSINSSPTTTSTPHGKTNPHQTTFRESGNSSVEAKGANNNLNYSDAPTSPTVANVQQSSPLVTTPIPDVNNLNDSTASGKSIGSVNNKTVQETITGQQTPSGGAVNMSTNLPTTVQSTLQAKKSSHLPTLEENYELLTVPATAKSKSNYSDAPFTSTISANQLTTVESPLTITTETTTENVHNPTRTGTFLEMDSVKDIHLGKIQDNNEPGPKDTKPLEKDNEYSQSASSIVTEISTDVPFITIPYLGRTDAFINVEKVKDGEISITANKELLDERIPVRPIKWIQ